MIDEKLFLTFDLVWIHSKILTPSARHTDDPMWIIQTLNTQLIRHHSNENVSWADQQPEIKTCLVNSAVTHYASCS